MGRRNVIWLWLAFFVILLISAATKAEITNINSRGNHMGACAVYASPDDSVLFWYCSMDNIMPHKPPHKFVRVRTFGVHPTQIVNNTVIFKNKKSKEPVYVYLGKPYLRNEGGLDILTYQVEVQQELTEALLKMEPLEVTFKIDDTTYVMPFKREQFLELAMIASLE